MQNKSLAIVVVNYNGKNYLEVFFQSLFDAVKLISNLKIRIIFVDNLSNDGSVGFVRFNYPSVEIIDLPRNAGYAGAGAEIVKNIYSDFYLICNNDIKFHKDSLLELIKFSDTNRKAGVLQPMPLIMSTPNLIDSCGSFNTSTGFLYHYGNRKPCSDQKYNKPFQLFSVKGMCMLVKREVVDSVGFFNPSFWCYYEETDFCHRAWLTGWESWYVPSAKIEHDVGGTSTRFKNSFIQYVSFRNRLVSFITNYQLRTLLKVLPIYFAINTIWLTVYILKGNFGIAVAPFKSILYCILNAKSIWQSRRDIQILRRRSDKELGYLTVNPNLKYYTSFFSGFENFEDKDI